VTLCCELNFICACGRVKTRDVSSNAGRCSFVLLQFSASRLYPETLSLRVIDNTNVVDLRTKEVRDPINSFAREYDSIQSWLRTNSTTARVLRSFRIAALGLLNRLGSQRYRVCARTRRA